jgi:putative FmdB family regulatory protein
MPLYEYECIDCGQVEEAFQKFSDKPLTTCKNCSGKLHKLISQGSFHLKGSGWYVTDYAGKSKTGIEAKSPKSESPAAKTEASTKTDTESGKKATEKQSSS